MHMQVHLQVRVSLKNIKGRSQPNLTCSSVLMLVIQLQNKKICIEILIEKGIFLREINTLIFDPQKLQNLLLYKNCEKKVFF